MTVNKKTIWRMKMSFKPKTIKINNNNLKTTQKELTTIKKINKNNLIKIHKNLKENRQRKMKMVMMMK